VKKDRLPEAGELLRKVVEIEPRNVFGQHALGAFYVRTANKTGAMQQYYILQNLDSKLAADLLRLIPK
jgi:Flp pilus assembly protein TadD